MKTRFLMVMVFCLGLANGSASAQSSDASLTRIQRSGLLRYGADLQGGEPYVYEDPQRVGQYLGFEVDLANALARELGVRARLVQQDWSNLVPSLERRSFDIALNGLEVTDERKARIHLSRPYYVFRARMMVRTSDTRLQSVQSVRGLRIGTLASSFSEGILIPHRAQIVRYEGVEEPYQDLVHGRIDGVLLDDVIANRYGQAHPELRVAFDAGESFYAIGLRKTDRALSDAVDAALTRIAETGELRTILERAGLWNEAQERLVHWSAEEARVYAQGGSTARTRFGFNHVRLFVQGALVTFGISLAAMCVAIALGLALALLRLYGPKPLRWFGNAYVELFRGTPVLLQLYLFYFGLFPMLRESLGWTSGMEYDALFAAIFGLGLNYAAYESEIYRAGIQAVPKGQLEASLVLGMNLPMALRRIVVPQAFRIALPGVTNDFIAMLKDSSLVSVITVVELTKQMTITAIDVRSWFLPGLLCAALYLAMSLPLSVLSRRLEAKMEGEGA